MRLEKLNLFNFRNYAEANLIFQGQITCFLGDNGSGKTNLLDAVHMLSLTRSAFGLNDTQSIKHGEQGFKIKGNFVKNDASSDVLLALHEGSRKQLSINDLPQFKYVEHIGNYPIVLISPYDTDLIRESSEIRRKFIDTTLAQTDKVYLSELMLYNRALKQRNSLLKSFAEGANFDQEMIDVYNEQLSSSALIVYKARQNFVDQLIPLFQKIYNQLLGKRVEHPAIDYKSDLHQNNDLKDILHANIKTDLSLQRTHRGIHRDDLNFSLNSYELKKFGSQGQQKSFVIALKLAQFLLLKEIKGFNPLILLDDIFDKLDDHRISHLLTLLGQEHQAQIFITDARVERTTAIFRKLDMKADFRLIKDGVCNAYERDRQK